ncbi:MAG: phage holin family protein [Patescibacteria group bacterium]|nr:phage holin family protein [Patescibacteria group bacterium]
MKDFLRQSLINSFSLYLVSSIFPGLTVPRQVFNLIWAGIIFTLINRLIKPIIKLFLLPINLITLGLFGWLANVLVLLISTRLVDSLTISGFNSQSFSYSGFSIPSLTFSPLIALITASLLLNLTFNLLDRLLVED